LHKGDIRGLYSSPNTVNVMKSRGIRYKGHVARKGEKRNACSILLGILEGKRSLVKLGVH
jgi:hypothetical protein